MLEVGGFVELRGRRWLVEDVLEQSGGDDLVSLSCLEDDAQGEQLKVIAGAEIDVRSLNDEWISLGHSGMDQPAVFGAFLRTLDWQTASAAERNLFQAPFRAGIRLDAYQLLPLFKALQLPRVNLLIADDVGLGKTIEAGLIARELLLRRRIDLIVVVAPPSMTLQWRDELEEKFGLSFTIMDREHFAEVRRARGFAVNPWDAGSRFIVSHRLLAEESYVAGLRQRLGEFSPRALLILDEAHHAAPAGGGKYAVASQFTKALDDLAPRFEHRLFLSATPHNGHPNSFSTLLEMLDPQRFTRGVPVRPGQLRPVMVRRLKSDLRQLYPGSFPHRVVAPIVLDGLPEDAPELWLAERLSAYGRTRELRVARLPAQHRAQARLVFSGLQQRLLSSIPAFARTLEAHRRGLERSGAPIAAAADRFAAGADAEPQDVANVSEDVAAELIAEGEARMAELASGGEAAEPDARRQELAAVDEMLAVALANSNMPDARVDWLIGWVRENCLKDSAWNDRRLIVFTEYEDTRRWLQRQLMLALDDVGVAEGRIATFTGATREDQRESVKRAFNADPAREPIRILLCTDAAREGVNLQMRCADLIHFDLPWNPARLEQRNGRIDRKLQPSPEVRCRYFLYRQRPEDVVLEALVRKTETIRVELGAIGTVIQDRVMDRMAASGIRRDIAADLARAVELETDADRLAAARTELEIDEDHLGELRREEANMQAHLERSRAKVGVDPGELQRVVGVALGQAGMDLRSQAVAPIGSVDAFQIEPQGVLADTSWAGVFDDLRDRPRGRRERLRDWRASTSLRKLVFEPPIMPDGRQADGVVQAHLEHRLVRRLLSRFLSQGFQTNLARACLIEGPGAEPRVLLLGRLSVYGPGAARLHEEVLEVAARWTDAGRDARPLKPYGDVNHERTLTQLKEALALGRTPRGIELRVAPFVSRDVADLSPHLEALAADRLERVTRDLAAQGEREAESLRRLLSEQRERILREQRRTGEVDQLLLPGLLDDERRQLAADRSHWMRRLSRLEIELAQEPQRVQEAYTVRAHRLEPVGVVYLWPGIG